MYFLNIDDGFYMSLKCELSGKKVLYGNKVSHSQRKTRRRFEPNIHKTKILSDLIGQTYTLRVSTSCLRTIEKLGVLDQYILNTSDEVLSQRAKVIKRKFN